MNHIRRAGRFQSPVAKHLFQNEPVRGVVINYEQRQVAQISHFFDYRRMHGLFLQPHTDNEMKGAPLVGFAIHPDAAAHLLNELRRDCQT